MMPDDICREYAESGLKIKVSAVDDVIAIEGTAEGLRFLAKLIAAQSESRSEGFGISPFGAGRSWFAPGSTKGLYIRRIDEDSENGPGIE